MFHGVTQINLDAKGRLAIPTMYRDELAASCSGQLVVTVDPLKCLLIYPQPSWEPIMQKLNSLPSFKPKIRLLQQKIIGNAVNVEMDGTGRILLKPALRQYADLNKNVVLVGQVEKFEVWNEDRWNERMDEELVFEGEDLPPELDGFSM